MNKMQMAHEWAMKNEDSKKYSFLSAEELSSLAWQYADAMQAEADKRISKERPDVLLTKDKDGNCLHFHHEFGHKKCMDCGASLKEWQPDWSQAPRWANWRVATADSNGEISGGWFYEFEPDIGDGTENSHSVYYSRGSKSSFTESFGYTGNWQDSLRERPEALQPEVDWRLAPNDAIGWMIFDGVSTWLGESGFLIEDAPSFGFTGTHIVERPQ